VFQDFKDLMLVVRMICYLFHGNANVERGFSVNAECLFKNMKEESIVACRQTYDAVLHEGGVDALEITKAFLHCARNTHSRYAEDLERRQQVSAAEQEASMKRKKILKVKELEVNCLRILENA